MNGQWSHKRYRPRWRRISYVRAGNLIHNEIIVNYVVISTSQRTVRVQEEDKPVSTARFIRRWLLDTTG